MLSTSCFVDAPSWAGGYAFGALVSLTLLLGLFL
jgi:hypothetical protein